MNSGTMGLQDKRRFVRTPFIGSIVLTGEKLDRCEVTVCNVSRGGLCVETGHPLHPGQRLLAEVREMGLGEVVELKTAVAWVAPFEEAGRTWVGLRVLHSEPESVTAMSTLLHKGLHQSGVFTLLGSEDPCRAETPQAMEREGRGSGTAAGFVTPLAHRACAAICAMIAGAALS
ncbi:MAG TPA: PilZ domain-containing protein [Candidatus Hydrogenedentes bacterium]|nr:PilZ domain-containing protein [Candidatus Hydrogenedentota bacterium]HOS02509.1 PilZ domain-containing protein [Candidatus Hydrogenedentota bacterium]